MLGWKVYVGGDWEQSLSVLLLCRRSALLLRSRSILLLYRRWVLAGVGYLGGDICVGDSGGSDILVVSLVVVVLNGGVEWRCWMVVVVVVVCYVCGW